MKTQIEITRQERAYLLILLAAEVKAGMNDARHAIAYGSRDYADPQLDTANGLLEKVKEAREYR